LNAPATTFPPARFFLRRRAQREQRQIEVSKKRRRRAKAARTVSTVGAQRLEPWKLAPTLFANKSAAVPACKEPQIGANLFRAGGRLENVGGK
jgi:hypothetical protein